MYKKEISLNLPCHISVLLDVYINITFMRRPVKYKFFHPIPLAFTIVVEVIESLEKSTILILFQT